MAATPLVEVVPRAWTHLLAIVAGRPLDPTTETPPAWRDYVAEVLGRTAPHRLTDGRSPAYRDWSGGYDPETWLDRAIMATRTEVFPLHGSTRCPDASPVTGPPVNQPDTPLVPQVSLVTLFPTGHIGPTVSEKSATNL